MKRIYTGYLLVFLWCSSFVVNAQDANQNQSKYWFYRYRLLSEFLVKGEDACGKPSGLMIPCGGAYHKPSMQADGITPILDENGEQYQIQMDYGDGTSFLGYYIGVLATEYKLLKNNPETSSEQIGRVKEELYLAMKAYERVDKNAEYLLEGCKQDGNCNSFEDGCFIRDDTPSSKLSGEPDEVAAARAFNDKFKVKLNREFTSTYGDRKHTSTDDLSKEHAFLSQDQLADLMIGFSLVVKIMGDESLNGYKFKDKAKDYTDEIVYRLQRNQYQEKVPGTNKNVKYGGIEIQQNAYGIAKAAQKIVNESFGDPKLNLSFSWDHDAGKYENFVTSHTSTYWQNYRYPNGEWFFNDFNFKGNQVEIHFTDDDDFWFIDTHEHTIPLGTTPNDFNNAIPLTFAAIGN